MILFIRKLKVTFYTILCLVLLLAGCSNSEIAKRDVKIHELDKKVETLNTQLDNAKKEIEKITMEDILLREKLKVRDKLSWIEEEKWDKVVIAPMDTDANYVFVSNQEILKHMNDFFYIKREVRRPVSDFRPDIPRYLYTFISEDRQYDVYIEARGIVSIDGHYYETNPYIHKLGDAFIRAEIWRKPGNIQTKIADSGLIMTSFGPIYSEWRIHMLADTIAKGKRIGKKPPIHEEEGTNYTAYYSGKEILLQAYSSYLYIRDGEEEYWYELEEAAYKTHHILNGMG